MDNNSKHKLRKTLVKAMVAYILHMNLNLNDDTLIARDETERLLTNPGFARHSKLVSIVGPQALVIKITREMGALITSDISELLAIQIIASKEVDSMNDEGHDDRAYIFKFAETIILGTTHLSFITPGEALAMHDPEGERDHWIYMDLDTQLNLVHNQTYVITQAPDWYRTKIPHIRRIIAAYDAIENDPANIEVRYRLDPDQKAVYDIMVRRFNDPSGEYPILLLPADTGYGKSRICARAAKHFYDNKGMKSFVVCPKTLIPMWTTILRDMNVEVVFIGTYDTLAGKKATGCKHPYLTRGTNPTGPFEAAQAWHDLITGPGVFVIADESQAVKNKTSARHWAFFALIVHAMTTQGAKFRCILPTASPIDKEENWACLFRNLGLITQRDLYHQNPGTQTLEYEQYGLGSLLQLGRRYNPRIVAEALLRFPIKAANMPKLLPMLWRHIFRERCVLPVTDPVYQDPNTGRVFQRLRANFFVTLDAAGRELAIEAIADLQNAHIVRRNGEVDILAAKRNFGIIQNALVKLCSAKITTVSRLSLIKLREGKKIIICCPFLEDQQKLKAALSLYGPLILNGELSGGAREHVVAKFNEPSQLNMVLIMTPEVGGEGISLHDLHGGFPRCMFILPTFNYLKCLQSAGRAYRRGIMSDTEVYIIYSNNAGIESILLNSLVKSEVAGLVLLPGSGRIFPGAYDYIIENDGVQHQGLRERLERERNSARAAMLQAINEQN
jgi:hypothetical protein